MGQLFQNLQIAFGNNFFLSSSKYWGKPLPPLADLEACSEANLNIDPIAQANLQIDTACVPLFCFFVVTFP